MKIGELKIQNGGEAVIRNVTVDSCSITQSSGSGCNVSIESGSFGRITCDDENYPLGASLAKGSRVRGMEYADAKTLGVGSNIIIEKCDHKGEFGAAMNDEGVCNYCNTAIAATVTYTAADRSEKTDLFGDICDAFDKANEAGTATVTLCSDITDTHLREIRSIGENITLDLNGKQLDISGFTLAVFDGTLTVNGNGFLDGLDVYGGTAEIQGGTIRNFGRAAGKGIRL